MRLKQKQLLFGKLLPELLDFIHQDGYQVIIGDAHRCEDCPVGHENSLHKLCLAIDLELHNTNGKYLTKTEDHLSIGEYWESLHSLCRWGGRWNDGNHYSIAHRGMK